MIKKLIFGSALLALSVPSFSMSFSQAKKIYVKLVLHNFPGGAPHLGLNPDPFRNAEYTGDAIYITQGMLQFVRNSHEMALVLGHELGHFKRNDQGSYPAAEYASDILGANYERKAGYNYCIGAEVLKRFNTRANGTHPDSDDRYYRLTKGCK